jgi:tetratricopeptide (TPR) repeat protein
MEYFKLVLLALTLMGIYYAFKLYIRFLDYYIDTFSLLPRSAIWIIVVFSPPFLILVISAYFRGQYTEYKEETDSNYNTGVALFMAGDFPAAQQMLLKPASRGNSDAMLFLSVIYGASENNDQTFYWANKAYKTSPKDDAILLQLAELHFLGKGTVKDFVMCRSLCKKISDTTLSSPQGNYTYKAVSNVLVAKTYIVDNETGWHESRTYKNIEKAITLFKLSGQSGYLAAYDLLGGLLMTGAFQVPKDVDRAIKYLKLAAEGGCIEANLTLFNHCVGQIENPLRFHQAYLWGSLMIHLGINDCDVIIRNIRKSIGTSKSSHLDFKIKAYIAHLNETECSTYNENFFLTKYTQPDLLKQHFYSWP